MNPHLFVYGSLVKAHAHEMGERLRSEAQWMGAATIPGRLYRIDWYPGLRPAQGPSDRVTGEVYRLRNVTHSLAWLDEYEGLVPGNLSAAASEKYCRENCEVQLTDGTKMRAWVYQYLQPLPEEAFIPDGIWRG